MQFLLVSTAVQTGGYNMPKPPFKLNAFKTNVEIL